MTRAPFVNIGPGAKVPARYLTRHVGIYGATGTGKTTTAAAMVERMADAGIPVLVLDAKGDLESMTRDGGTIWDVTGERGTVRRLSLGGMGPDAVARALELTEAQAGTLEIAQAYAAGRNLALHSLADLRNVLGAIVNNRAAVESEFGLVSPASVAAIQRALLRLERTAPDAFGGPFLDPFEAAERDEDGRGLVTVLRAAPLTHSPGLYGAAVAYILDSLYSQCAELGDVAAPGLAVFIDESHLVFNDAPRAIIHRLETVTRLIRSKGVALIFATQSPADLPPAIAGQLATRIQHGLRGSTGKGLAEIRAAADTMPGNHWRETVEQIKTLGVGQALVSVPGAGGIPQPAQLVQVVPARVQPKPLDDSELQPVPGSYFPDGQTPISPTVKAPILPPDYFDRQELATACQVEKSRTRRAWEFWATAGLVLYLAALLL